MKSRDARDIMIEAMNLADRAYESYLRDGTTEKSLPDLVVVSELDPTTGYVLLREDHVEQIIGFRVPRDKTDAK